MISLVTGCAAKDDAISVEQKLNQLFQSPYEAQCIAVVKSNKTENTYAYTCSKNTDGMQKLDFGDMLVAVSPDGAVIERNGEKISTTSAEGELELTPDYFFKNHQNNGEITETLDGYNLECDVVNGNQYRNRLVMETDENFVPERMIIEDKNGEIRVDIKIEKFLKQ